MPSNVENIEEAVTLNALELPTHIGFVCELASPVQLIEDVIGS